MAIYLGDIGQRNGVEIKTPLLDSVLRNLFAIAKMSVTNLLVNVEKHRGLGTDVDMYSQLKKKISAEFLTAGLESSTDQVQNFTGDSNPARDNIEIRL